MDSETPKKETIKIKLTPTTKQFMCILCGEIKQNRKDRHKLEREGTSTDLYALIEKLIGIKITSESHSSMCCRTCALRLKTIDKSLEKFKETYKAVQERLEVTHGHKTTKRMSSEHGGTSKRKALFSEDQLPTVTGLAPPNESDNTSSPYCQFMEPLALGKDLSVVDEIMKNTELAESFTDRIFETLKEEIRHLCSKTAGSVLRDTTKNHLLTFSFKKVASEWKEKAPLFYRFIICTSSNPKAQIRNRLKKDESILQAQVAAGCKLLNIYNRDMKCLQQINNILFLHGGMKKSGFTRMHSTKDCQSYLAALELSDRLADAWDEELTKWQQQNKLEHDVEAQLTSQVNYITDTIELCGGEANEVVSDLVLEKASLLKELEQLRLTMDPGYYFVGDNVDMITKVRHMTARNQNKDHHMFQLCTYKNRVSGNHLDNSKPQQNAAIAGFSQLVPGLQEHEKLSDQFTYLIAKQWCTSIQHLAPYQTVLPAYIDHPYIKQMKERTVRVNMGVLRKNESKNEDMAEICKFLHKYVPGHDVQSRASPVKVLSGGDYLTFERHKQAQMSVRDDETPSLRLEGLVPRMEEFHNQAELLKVMWQNLYSTASSRDIGTMFAARNLVNAKNVTKDPAGNYYASATMADKFTNAYIIAGGLDHFLMKTISDAPTENLYSGDIGNQSQMKTYILQQARSFVDKYVCITVEPLPDYGPQCNTLTCRYCDKEYKQARGLRKHENKVHGHFDPLFEEHDSVNDKMLKESNNPSEDFVQNYTKLTLTLGLLRQNHNDAISMGDGERIMLVNQYLYLLYKCCNCPKYAFGILETICQSKILLTERLAHRLIWNRTVNHRGKKNTNHPNDLDIEHCNKIFKDQAHSFRGVFTEKTISRVSRSAVSSHQIAENFDKQTDTRNASGIHKESDLSQDINLIVNQLIAHNVFSKIPGRTHETFPEVNANPFGRLDMEQVRDWISKCLKKYSAKHFY